MTTTTSASDAPARAGKSSVSTRWLYFSVSLLMLILTFLGFQQFYLHGQAYPAHPLPPPAKMILIAHGLAMSAWMILAVVQPLLIATGNRRLHMTLGIGGACLAAFMFFLGLYVPIAVARVEPDVVIWGLHRPQFMAIPFFAILTFATFVAIGVRYRKQPAIHRPMMLLASLAIMAAAMDRITGLPDLWQPTIWGRAFGPFFGPLAIGAAFLVVKSAVTRSFDRRMATGLLGMAAVFAFTMRLAPTDAWTRFAHALIGH